MGRRKIEIQPITHERNRSVTFLKRKNGLFKKAYELGVLCSVDVAVIIFEDRPGHDLKLHQYSSSDIRDIIQRQLRHQGEKDIKVPGDFSGAGGAKFDDNGGDDDDNMEEDEEVPLRTSKRRAAGKSTAPDEQELPAPRVIPTHSHHLRGGAGPRMEEPSNMATTFLPVSNDRVSSLRDSHTRSTSSSKRPRLVGVYNGNHSRSPSEDGQRPNGNPELYLPDQGPGRYNIRQIPHPNQPPQHMSHSYPHHEQMHPPQGYNSQYGPLFPAQASPPTEFVPLHPDFGPRGQPHHSMPRGDFGAPGYNAPQRGRGSPYEAPVYGTMVRNPAAPFPPQQQARQPYMGGRDERGNMFTAFLEADERNRQQQGMEQQVAAGAVDLVWPVHDGVRTAPSPMGGTQVRNPPTLPQPVTDPSGNGGWLDFLSSDGSKANQASKSTSFERGGVGSSNVEDIASIFGVGSGVDGRATAASSRTAGREEGLVERPAQINVGDQSRASVEVAAGGTISIGGSPKAEPTTPDNKEQKSGEDKAEGSQ